MKLQFNGAAREVGKSCFSLTTGEKNILLDCGLKMAGGDRPTPTSPPLEKIKRPDVVLLSHAHLDHCGAIPELYKHSAPITYCTTPTAALAQILYEDTLKIARQEKLPAVFSKQDLAKAEKHFSALGYENEFSLGSGVKFSFHDAGHILGSAQILVKADGGKKLLYTGDFKARETRMHGGAKTVDEKIDLLVIESTYANHEQPDRKKVEKQFFNEVQDVVDQNGVVLLPCFAVGRTQEILSILSENNLKGDIYIQGMGTKVNQLYHDYPSYIKNSKSLNSALARARQIDSKEEKKAALKGGSIIVSTAGMLEGGPAVRFIQEMENLTIPTAIFLTGFQVPGTNGYRLLQGKKITAKNKKNKANNQANNQSNVTFQVTSAVKLFEFSAHADKEELYEFVKKINPEKVACIHGDEGSCESFAKGLKEKGFDAIAPKLGEKMEL